MAEKKELGFSELHLKDLRLRLGAFCLQHGSEGTRTLTPEPTSPASPTISPARTSDQVREWLYRLKLSPTTINSYRSRLSALFGFGVERHYMDKNPVDEIAKKKVVDEAPEIFAPTNCRSLNNAIDRAEALLQ